MVVLLSGVTAFAEQKDKDWYVAFRLGYFPYTADVEGTVGNRDFKTEAEFSDVMDKTETILGGEVEFGKDKWFVSLASFYQEVETEKGNSTIGAEITAYEFAANPMVGYRAYQTMLEGGHPLVFDVMAGIYYVKLNVDVDVFSPLGNVSKDKSINFTDPMFGGRGYYGFSKKFGFGAAAQVGGFGVGSEIHYQLGANLNYAITSKLTVSGGYKYWYWDYEDDDAILKDLEQTLSGPVIGLQYKI
jgi:hypothetical protein